MKSYRYHGLEFPCALVKWTGQGVMQTKICYRTLDNDGQWIVVSKWVKPSDIKKGIHNPHSHIRHDLQVDYRNGPDGHRPTLRFSGYYPNREWVKEKLWNKHGEKLVAKNMNRSLWPVISDLVELSRNISFAYDEMEAFHAPSECGDLISKGAQKSRHNILKKHGWGKMTLDNVIAKRVDQKWMYMHGYFYI